MKLMRWVQVFFVILIQGVLVLGPISRSYAQPLPEAVFYGVLSWFYTGGGPKPAPSAVLNHEGVISYDCMISMETTFSQYVATLQFTDGSRPMVDLHGSAHWVGDYAKAEACIIYYLQADKKDLYAPDVTVPLRVSSSGHVSVTNTANSYSSASSWFGTPSNPAQDQILGGYTTDTVAHWEGSRTVIENVPIGVTYAIVLSASALVSASGGGESGGFQAVIDPMVQIDPTWVVYYNGEYVPGNQLYSLRFSPGFNPVPLPGVLMLLLD
jgi:hypothetical protein